MARIKYIIANHNYSKYLKSAIDSALRQTYPCKLCIGDDASTDTSWEIIKAYFPNAKEIDKGEYILIEENGHIAIRLKQQSGPSHVRNLLIDLTIENTDYYAILDADDENYPNKIEKCMSVFFKYPEVAIVYADYHIINEQGIKKTEHKESYSYNRLIQECIIHSGSMIRGQALKDVVEQTGWYDFRIRCSEDYDLWLRICEKYMAYHIAEPLSLVRVHSQNSTNSVSQSVWQQCWAFVQEKFKQRHG